MRKQKKRKSKLKIILIIVFLLLTLNCIRNNRKSIEIFFNNISNSSVYKVVKQDLNNNYSGVGQKKFLIKMVILQHLQLLIIKNLLNTNKMEIVLGVIIHIGVVLWKKMDVESLQWQSF